MAGTGPPPQAPPCVYLDSPTLHSLLPLRSLLSHLRTSLPLYSSHIFSPPRLSFPLPAPSSPPTSAALSTMLLMPAFSSHPSLPYLSLKTLTSFPHLSPSIHGTLSLFHSISGQPLALLDATALTLLRTSAVSALAASILSLPSPSTLLLCGAGALAPYLLSSFLSTFPSLSCVLLHNRTPSHSLHLLNCGPSVSFHVVDEIDEAVSRADIICCATRSQKPLIKGQLLKPGAHLDLVGSYTPDMMECDDEAMVRGRVFIDVEAAVEEAGEIAGAIKRGVISREHVVGTLPELCGGTVVARRSEEEITVFKSIGTAAVDLLAAQLAYETHVSRNRYSYQN